MKIGSRGSKLALWHANWVKAQLEAAGHSVTIEVIQTTGDRIQNMPLSEAGGTKALFVKEIEEALLEGRVDLAVHSLKDMPAEQPAGLRIAAVPLREDPRDVLIGHLNPGARVGTSSLRRAAQLRAKFPGIAISPLRGNLDTRVRRLDDGAWDGIVVAAAGLHRLGMVARITRYLEAGEMCPAIGQGALAIQTRMTDTFADFLDHAESRWSVTAERAVMRLLGGGCRLPLAAYAVDHKLTALVASPDGSRVIEAGEASGPGDDPEELGERVARILIERGAKEILAEIPIA